MTKTPLASRFARGSRFTKTPLASRFARGSRLTKTPLASRFARGGRLETTSGDYGFEKTLVYSFVLAFNLFTLYKDQNLTFFSIVSLFLTSVEVGRPSSK